MKCACPILINHPLDMCNSCKIEFLKWKLDVDDEQLKEIIKQRRLYHKTKIMYIREVG